MSIISDRLIPLAEAAKRLPGRPHVSTLHRWRTRGVRGIRLRTMKIGGRRVVALSDLEDFVAAVTAASDGERPAAPRSSKQGQRQRDIAKAEAELDRLGIGNQCEASDKECD